MNASDYSDLLAPLALGVANLFFAGLLHRSIVHDPTLLRRRHFFESLAVLALLVALLVLVAGIALWRGNPHFVLVCSVGWMVFCLIVAAILRYRKRRDAADELAVPESWPTLSDPPADGPPGAPVSRRPETPVPSEPNRGRTVPLDALTRARMKRALRERSVDGARARAPRPARPGQGSRRPDRLDDE